MHLNVRNSREIVEVAKTVKSDRYERRITSVIDILETWKSSITSFLPTIFPITKETLDNNYSKVFKHVTENGNGINVILVSSESEFDVQKIKESLLSCDVQEEDIFVHLFSSNNTKEDIKNFIRRNRGVLI